MGCAGLPVAGVGMNEGCQMLPACSTGPHRSQQWCSELQSPEGRGRAAQEPGSQMWSHWGARRLICTSIEV